MPDVFVIFFNDFQETTSIFYTLEKLAPGYQVYFGKDDSLTISDSLDKIYEVFEKEEKGAAKKLKAFLALAEKNYRIAIQNLVYKPGLSPLELITKDTITEFRQFIVTIHQHVQKNFKRSLRIHSCTLAYCPGGWNRNWVDDSHGTPTGASGKSDQGR